MVAHAAAFLGVAALVIVTPGQDTALTIRNTLARGRRGGVQTAVGVSLGQLVWAVSASVGLAALLSASEPAFLVLRLAGAAYLLYLGITALRAAFTRSPELPHERPRRRGSPLLQGLLSNLGNPKMAVFFTSLLPQFAPHGSFATLLALGAVFCTMTLLWLTLYAAVVARAGLLLRPRVRRALDAVTGTVLVALGLRVASTAP
jgi:threonine/homoserine/homoserine lactone efflux protein